jgi:hypothetical protein
VGGTRVFMNVPGREESFTSATGRCTFHSQDSMSTSTRKGRDASRCRQALESHPPNQNTSSPPCQWLACQNTPGGAPSHGACISATGEWRAGEPIVRVSGVDADQTLVRSGHQCWTEHGAGVDAETGEPSHDMRGNED